MTSANSSLGKCIKEQRAITMRRLPLAALAIITYFLYDVFGTMMEIQRERSVSYLAPEVAVQTFPERGAQIVSTWMGLRGIGWGIGCVGAVLLAIQGFAWLYRSQTVDFYESRPEKRSTRFVNIVVNGLFIYTLPSLIGVFLAYLLTVLNGCGPLWLLAEMLIAWVYQTVLFLAVYAMSILASLLTGTVVTAVLMNAWFFGIEALLRIMMAFHRSAYYSTFDYETADNPINRIWTLPPYHYLAGLIESKAYDIQNSSYGWANALRTATCCLSGAFINFGIFVVCIVAAWFVYRARRAEYAGKAVTYRGVAVFIKFTAATLFSLCFGLFVYWIFDERRGAELTTVILAILLSVFVICILLEAIFALNIRMAFHRLWQAPVIAGIALIVLFIYRTDAFGYDRWVPGAEQVTSAWLLNDQNYRNYYDENGNYSSQRDYVSSHMFLTNIEDMQTLASITQKAKCDRDLIDFTVDEYTNGWYATIGWRMKNGEVRSRCVWIPEDIDPALMDRLVGTEAYIKGCYQYLDDPSYLRRFVDSRAVWSGRDPLQLMVYTEHGTVQGKGSLSEDFFKTYEKDMINHYNFTLASEQAPVGAIDIEASSGGLYFAVEYPLFEEFTETIAFLDDNGLWPGGFLNPREIDHVRIYIDRWDEETETWNDVDEVCSDPAEIRELMEASVSTAFTSVWEKYGLRDDTLSASLTIYPIDPQIQLYQDEDMQMDAARDPEVSYGRAFLKGRVPAFVEALAAE